MFGAYRVHIVCRHLLIPVVNFFPQFPRFLPTRDINVYFTCSSLDSTLLSLEISSSDGIFVAFLNFFTCPQLLLTGEQRWRVILKMAEEWRRSHENSARETYLTIGI